LSDETEAKTSDETETAPPEKGKRRRLLIRGGIAAGLLVLLFVLIVFVLPTPLARYVIDSQLEQLGIEHDGIQTVDIDLWNSRVRAGPVLFSSGEAEPGQIGETGFDYSFRAIFKGRAFIQTFYLRGVDLFVERLENGSIEINGINLTELAAKREEEGAAEPPEEEEEGEGFAFGVDSFEFTDSKLAFQDLTGGSLVIEVERLTLDRLIGWTPEEPTGFALEGRLNEIGLSLDGTIVPLTDPLRLTLDTRLTGVTLERVSRFIGPTGLAREEGTLDTDVSYDFKIHKDGRVDGKVEGRYQFSDFLIATESGEEIALGSALLEVALEQALDPDGSVAAKGQLSLNGSPLTFSSAQGDSARIGSLELTFKDLDFIKGAEQRQMLFDLPGTVSGGETARSSAPSIIELLIGWAREIGLNTLRHNLEINGEPRLVLKEAELRSSAGEVVTLEELDLGLGVVATRALGSEVGLSAGLALTLRGLGLAGSGPTASLSDFSATSESIELKATRETTSLALDLALGLEGLSAADGQGLQVGLQALTFGSESFTGSQGGERGEASGPVSLSLRGLDAALPAAESDPLALRGETLDLTLAPLTLTDEQGLSAATLDGVLEIGSVSLSRGGPQPLEVTLGSLRSDLGGLRASPLSADASVSGAIATGLSSLSGSLGGGEEAISFSLESLSNRIESLSASGFAAGEPEVSLSKETDLTGLAAGLPLGGGQRLDATLASATASLSSLRVSGQELTAEGALSLGALAAAAPGESEQALEIAGIDLAGLSASSAGAFAAESLCIGDLTASLTLPLPGQGAAGNAEAGETSGSGGASAPSTPTDTQTPTQQAFRLGQLTLAPGSRIEITDKGAEPPLKASLVIEQLEVGPLDSGAPETRSDLALSASVNETTKATLTGWAKPFKADPDFDLQSRVEELVLPLLSPYAAKAVGVDIESGALTANLGASATSGALDGKIDLSIDDLFVVPISEEEAEKLKANVGLPVGFAVSILKDSNGVIELGFPLSGTLEEPVVDYSEAIDKAIAGAMAAVFPVSWFGPDGNSFEMQPATFLPGGTELTEDGKAVADEMGELFSKKPGISIRACGRAARADLVALRGGAPEEPLAAAPEAEASGEETAAPVPTAPPASPPAAEIADPSEAEVEALLALATERGQAVRQYLESAHGIEPARLPECRTGYSVKDGKAPRAEFQF
jgi:hypothetical protein